MTTTRIRRMLALPVVLGAALALAVTASPAQAQNDWVEPATSYMSTVLTGGDYVWGAAVWQPAPALLAYGWDDANQQEVAIPPEWVDSLGLQPLTGTFDWGDGTTTAFDSAVRTDMQWVWCNNGVETVDGVPVAPGEGFGYNCRIEAGHTYATQGVMTVRLTVNQGGETATSESPQFVVDPTVGGSLTLKGTVEARSGGMYDQDFPQPGDTTTTSVSVTAKRRAGTTATTATVVVSAPGMHPEWNNATGMTFRGSYALQPLYVAKTRTGGEAVLMRVEGRVTNNKGDAGGAQAVIRVKVQKGSPTLVRVQVWNTSAGFTYLDTGYQPESWLSLSTHDVLLTGSAKLG